MALETITEFLDSATVMIWAYTRNPSTDALADVTSVTISVYDPTGTTKVDASAMTNSTTGTYYYKYHLGTSSTAMTSGDWRYLVKAIEGTGATAAITPKAGHFKVK